MIGLGLIWLLCTYSPDECPVPCLSRHQEYEWVETEERLRWQVRDICDEWDTSLESE
jgi:hypothetical protein